ncbi:MAG: 30S ribosomal protein S20 [Bacteroidota bacterium]
MAQHKSAIKRIRTSEKKKIKNKVQTSKLRTLVKKVRSEKNKETALKLLKETTSYLDTLAGKGVIHKNKASNQKSKISKLVNSIK